MNLQQTSSHFRLALLFGGKLLKMQKNTKQIDKRLSVDLDSILGKGPNSIVYKGKFEGFPVAVKVIKDDSLLDVKKSPSEAAKQALRERSIMCQMEEDRRWNIVGFYYSVLQKPSMYLALQLCDGHLREYINNDRLVSSYPPLRVNHDIAVAVQYLHAKSIVHRDLKPENIFYCLSPHRDRIEKVVVGDFGISKTTTEDICSISSWQVGTLGYISQEVWNQLKENDDPNFRKRMTLKSDIFAMGCIFYYTVTGGKNPFGKIDTQANIGQKKPPDLDKLEKKQQVLRCLLENALSHDEEERPNATQVLNHPALWRSEKILKFLTDVSDEVEHFAVNNQSELAKLENLEVIWGGNWYIDLPTNLYDHLLKYQQNGRHIYRERFGTVGGTLRVIRNVASHYKNFPTKAREELGSPPDGHLDVWFETCPDLFMHVYTKMSEIRRNLGIDCDLSQYAETAVQQRESTVQPSENHSEGTSQHTDIRGEDESTDQKSIARSNIQEFQSEVSRQQTDIDGADQSTELKTVVPSNVQGAVSDLTEKVSNFNISTGIGGARLKIQQKHIPVISQSARQHHILDDAWMRMARNEIDEGKRTDVKLYIGQFYVLCVDISESMADGYAWHQAKNFVESFISGLENLQKLHLDIPVYLALVTFGLKTEVVQRYTNEMKLVETAFEELRLGGPTPMYGGITLGTATAGIPERGKGNPTLILVTDGKPTEKTLYAGPDSLDSSKEHMVKEEIIQVLLNFKDGLNFAFVSVGNPDSEFISIMAAVCQGQLYSHEDGHTILRRQFGQERNFYYERESSTLPPIGSRVIRGPDWNFENQDGFGPGTIIGHDSERDVVWVEWDADGSKNCYQYGCNGLFDVSLTDNHGRKISETGDIYVGCCVTEVGDASGKFGTVIKVLHRGRVEVRWNDGTRGEYSFGKDDLFQVLPYFPDTIQSSETTDRSTNVGQSRNTERTSTNSRPFKNKNAR